MTVYLHTSSVGKATRHYILPMAAGAADNQPVERPRGSECLPYVFVICNFGCANPFFEVNTVVHIAKYVAKYCPNYPECCCGGAEL